MRHRRGKDVPGAGNYPFVNVYIRLYPFINGYVVDFQWVVFFGGGGGGW